MTRTKQARLDDYAALCNDLCAELDRAKAKADRYESLLDLLIDLRCDLDKAGVQTLAANDLRRRLDTALCEE